MSKKTGPPSEGEGQFSGSRRDFLKQSSFLSAIALTPTTIVKAAEEQWDEKVADVFEKITVNLEVNGVKHTVKVEPRVTLLDLLREQLNLTGSKKGCDRGQCGACTVHVNGVRINSCLSLAVTNEGKKVIYASGLTRKRINMIINFETDHHIFSRSYRVICNLILYVFFPNKKLCCSCRLGENSTCAFQCLFF